MRVLFFILMSCCIASCFSQSVIIPDTNFRNRLLDHWGLDVNGNDTIEIWEANTYTGSINVAYSTGLPIQDITGIEQFKLITSLDCSWNPLVQVDLSQNLYLNNLIIEACELTSLNLEHNVMLNTIWCQKNEIDTLDVSMLPKLAVLYCHENNLQRLDVSRNGKLTQLHCENNSLSSLDLRNGNNMNLFELQFYNNSGLSCVSVDDPTYSTTNWSILTPAGVSYSNSCGSCDLRTHVKSVTSIACDTVGFVDVNISGGANPTLHELRKIGSQRVHVFSSTSGLIPISSQGNYVINSSDQKGCESVVVFSMDGPKTSEIDLRGYIQNPDVFRPGRSTSINIIAGNYGCTPQSGQISLVYDTSLVTYDSSSVNPDNIIGDTLIWDFTDHSFDVDEFISAIYFTVDSSADIGDEVCFNLLLTPTLNDVNPTNNFTRHCIDVLNSFDPNNKTFYPKNECREDFVALGEPITYTINFQNVGNVSALDVIIRDTISNYLNLNTFDLISQSHPNLVVNVDTSNGVLRFEYIDINLSDSMSDPIASKGFVMFQLTPYDTLPVGTIINNSANIYFDFNDPITTNVLKNELVASDSLGYTQYIDYKTGDSIEVNGIWYTKPGIYYQYYQTINGCDSSFVIRFFEKDTTLMDGVSEIFDSKSPVNIYPNPTTRVFNVNIELNEIVPIKIQVIDLYGKVVTKLETFTEVGENSFQFEGNKLPSGMYLVEIVIDQRKRITKLLFRN